jgi:uncharacterized protein (DUF488 family)
VEDIAARCNRPPLHRVVDPTGKESSELTNISEHDGADGPGPPPIFTVGHSTRTIEAFVDLLRVGRVDMVVDIRSVPRSRTNPQFNLDVLPQQLSPFGIAHLQIAELGGLRGKSREVPPDVNGFWQNRSFHNYADYALSDAFDRGLGRLLELSAARRCAIMCAEAVWWRCHRRIVADYLILRARSVWHLMGDARAEPAKMTDRARPSGSGLVYPAPDAAASCP